MTFEEALKLVEEKASVYWGTYRVENLVNDLQETYAPKIKMPQKIMLVFMEMKFNYQVDFEFFWKLMGDCVATDYLRENYKEEEIMTAWLHPELVEVKE
ncbi:hypothetical protein GU333_03945 [Lactococcus raffinolactis]|uniref:hypothetical protein n=1 Tax=Pseudolactococcus raffinolactis TaxID=1366 RepID=UPI001436CA19|nr:hypothetical protein [Lactococcus raffinolactis]QIW60322.1 hypothetical protein GU333_03945 [Lactococcus raffinolactis]